MHYRQCGDEVALDLATRYLSFLVYAQLPDGHFHNMMSYARQFLDERGSEDTLARPVGARDDRGTGARRACGRWRVSGLSAPRRAGAEASARVGICHLRFVQFFAALRWRRSGAPQTCGVC